MRENETTAETRSRLGIVPDAGLGNAKTAGSESTTLNSNVVVNVEVASDLSVATEVDDNGSIFSDMATTFGLN